MDARSTTPATPDSSPVAPLTRRPRLLLAAVAVLTAALAVPFLAMAPQTTASQEPGGAVFDARDRIDERFVSSTYVVSIVAEAADGNLLDRGGLLALHDRSEALRSDPDLSSGLLPYYDDETDRDVVGFVTVADLVDDALPEGLAAATDAEVAATLDTLVSSLGERSPALGLSQQASRGPDGWSSPAVVVNVVGDNTVLGLGNQGVTLGADTDGEEWARRVVERLEADQDSFEALGVAIDVNLTSAEQGAEAGPFIGFTVLAVLLVLGWTFRSYWAVAVTGSALAALIVWLKGISNLIGLEDDLVLSLVVPIAMISFGIDFAFHSLSRYREERQRGLAPLRAYRVGLAGVFAAITVALVSDAAAFLSNVSSGIPSIVQFGIGAAVALVAAYLLLGIVTPLAVALTDDRRATIRAGRWGGPVALGASLGAGLGAMTTVLLLVYVAPAAGVVALALGAAVFLGLPVLLSRPIVDLTTTDATDAPSGSTSSGPELAGGASPRLGRWIAGAAAHRRIVVPAALAATALAVVPAATVPAEFDVRDFFAGDTDFVRSLDALDTHVGDRAGEPGQLYVEADVNDPAVLARLDAFVAEVGALDEVELARTDDGRVAVGGGTSAVLDEVYDSPFALAAIGELGGVAITDVDGDDRPDDPVQAASIWAVTREIGVPIDGDRVVLTPGDVRTSVWTDGDGTSATVFGVQLTNSRSQSSIVDVRQAVAPLLDELRTDLAALGQEDAVVELTGGPVVRQAGLEAVSRALQVSLPIAVVLCFAIAAVATRSARLGALAVAPIVMTVSWLYAAMHGLGYSINLVTATIGAVSIGIGIDFAIHFLLRYREELDRGHPPVDAVRRTGEGTGSALVGSALSSAIGFAILAFAPMPLFASYGLLTAIMIVLAAVATLAVLPGLLLLVDAAPKRPTGRSATTPQPVSAWARAVAVDRAIESRKAEFVGRS